MSDNAENAGDDVEPEEPHGTKDDNGNPTSENGQSDDLQAKLDEAVKNSRKWENRAKENKAAADELQKLKESQMTESEKTEARIASLEKENSELKTREQVSAWKKQVSKDTGVPADVLRGSTLEEIQSHGEALKKLLSDSGKPKLPEVKDGGRQPKNRNTNGADDWLRTAFRK